jgi:2-C-methyl-D-erythritol 4-phosphate cytidylyltransferase/2-C-methyl-D-erythritol 2,4-cyclodiphosphate synthase
MIRGPVVTIVVAAGSGSRLGAAQPKAEIALGGRPMVAWSVETALAAGSDQVVVVAPPEAVDRFRARLADWADRVTVVAGGDQRPDSVRCGLALLDPAVEVVLVHDAARPLTPLAVMARVIAAVRAGAVAVVPVLPAIDSMRQVAADSPATSWPIERGGLRRVQTPQGFAAAALKAAHDQAVGGDFSDDATVMEAAGHPVSLVEGDPAAGKITEPLDLRWAEAQLAAAQSASSVPTSTQIQGSSMVQGSVPVPSAEAGPAGRPGPAGGLRTGVGFDAHRLRSGRPLWLAGLLFPDQPAGLEGHSDGDVAAHAACDALLGAAGLGDLGSIFGLVDPRWAGASGRTLLAETASRVRAAGFDIEHIAIQVIGPHPRLAPRRAEAEAGLAEAVAAPVSISATTTDGLGFCGRGEGLAALATVLLRSV